MEEIIQNAMREALSKAWALDPDLYKADVFAEALSNVKVENGNVVGVDEAVRKMRALKPRLFASWDTMSDEDFEKREAALRQEYSKRKPRQARDDFRDLDSSRLNEVEFKALGQYLRDMSDPSTVAILKSALARQISENNSITQEASK